LYESTKLDTNIVSTHSKIISVSAANALLVLVNLDAEHADLSVEAYVTATNKHYRAVMAVMQRASVVPADLLDKYSDGKLNSI